ncbi:SusC/RagA family TonB-linked outer membrane protein [Sphingobacterium sp. HSC-15S19]|uniref:SusC/RagA family TonB-linked outer membrane protein n=1 Tax=Sphingobacterium sp. HSC-15S19 TaxID=2910971 RepID=UPI003D1D1575
MNKFLIPLTFMCVHVAHAQESRELKGKVLDAVTLKPVVGATVVVESSAVAEDIGVPNQVQQSALGSLTDATGEFRLKVPSNLKYVTISYVGYQRIQVPVFQDHKTILLQPSGESLDEVIVTGYTDIKKRKNTTAYNKINVADIKQTGVASIDEMLAGQVAGLQLSNFSGGPNSAPQIRIRGTVSLNGTQDPLWVIDGLPIEGTEMPNRIDKDNLNSLTNLPIAGINPDDIADITVLKDAAATSIYGARAANGVIVITTKRGKSGPAKLQVSANTFVTERPDYSNLNLMNANEKVDFELLMANRTDLNYRTNKGAIMRILNKADALDAYRSGGLAALSPEVQQSINQLRSQQTDWGKELYRQALNQQYSASISGGNDGHRYYLSSGLYDEKGATKGVDLRRYTLTLNNDFNINDRFKAGINLMGTVSNRQNPIQDRDAFTNPSYYVRSVNPYLSVYDQSGNYNYDPDIEGFEGDTYIPFNAVEERENTKYKFTNKGLKAISYLEYTILPQLSLRTEFGLQFDENGSEKFADQESYNTRKLRAATRYYDAASKTNKYFLPIGGTIENTHNSIFQYNWKTYLKYNKTWNDRHELEVMGGTELRRTKNTMVTTKGFGYNPATLTTQTIIFPNSTYQNDSRFVQYKKAFIENSYASFYGNATYTLDRKYNVYGSIRYDGSNMFGVDPQYRFLPIWSISGSWNVLEEEFIKGKTALSDLRVRASYGIQGNVDRNTYPFIVGKYGNTTLLPGNTEGSVVVDMPANDKLRWERTKTYNAGIDLGLWKNRLNITVDYYNRKSTDLIAYSALPLENGFQNVQVNWASARNQGVELTISSRQIQTDKFSWSTDFNIAHNNNKLLKVINNPTAYAPETQAGRPINGLYVLETAGLDKDGVMQFRNQDGSVASMEEFYGLYDPWADFLPGYTSQTDMTAATYRSKFKYAGSKDPKFIGGMTNRFRYGQFDLAISAVFNLERWVSRTPTYNPAKVDRGQNYTKDLLMALQGKTALPALGSISSELNERWMAYAWMESNDPINSFKQYDIWAKKMSYVRINSIRLGYTLPAAISKKIGTSNLRVNVEGRNLFVFGTNYDGYFDPETYGDYYAQPISKSFAFGLSASF